MDTVEDCPTAVSEYLWVSRLDKLYEIINVHLQHVQEAYIVLRLAFLHVRQA